MGGFHLAWGCCLVDKLISQAVSKCQELIGELDELRQNKAKTRASFGTPDGTPVGTPKAPKMVLKFSAYEKEFLHFHFRNSHGIQPLYLDTQPSYPRVHKHSHINPTFPIHHQTLEDQKSTLSNRTSVHLERMCTHDSIIVDVGLGTCNVWSHMRLD